MTDAHAHLSAGSAAVAMLWKMIRFYDEIDRDHADGEAKLLDEAAAVVAAAQSPVPAQTVQVPDGYILVPRELTAENGAKAALIGEFNEEFGCLDEDGEEQFANVPVTWTTIKAIHKKMVAHFDASQPPAAPVEPCEYCGDGRMTGLSGNACENCMNTGLKYPEHGLPPDVAREALASQIVQAVAELPDRTSPNAHAGMMLVTVDELFDILCERLPLSTKSAPEPLTSQHAETLPKREPAAAGADPQCSAATERDDHTCYIERSKVRMILLDQPDVAAETTSYILHDIDQLPIFTAEDFRAVPQAAVTWPEPKVTNPDIAQPTGVAYLDCLIHRLLDAQQDLNEEANSRMSQSLCDASALIDEVEQALRKVASAVPRPTLEPQQVSAWQPIATAPKMRVILLFAVTDVDEDGRVRNWKMATGSWHSGWEGDEKQTAWFWDGYQVPKYAVQPTHWMPLPEAPSSQVSRPAPQAVKMAEPADVAEVLDHLATRKNIGRLCDCPVYCQQQAGRKCIGLLAKGEPSSLSRPHLSCGEDK